MDSSVCIEIEDQPLVVVAMEDQVTPKKPMRSYTRDFLLSLSDLEVCKKLPDGFDESLLSEFEESSHGNYDRPRVGSSLQGFKRSDNGSSAPVRGDSSSFSRGPQRWDTRSSGKSDTDTDSESGRRYSNQTRKSEHDGLLGSGSFPRPNGATVPKFRPNNFSLNKSNEPYHPPRPYKASPHTRRETNDSFNDETFGSTDSTNEDRVEEEKKRRAEFELMRKEQQKVLQDKQKSNSRKLENPFADITGMPGNPAGTTIIDTDDLSKDAPHDDVSKHRVTSSRPLVPPGFVTSVVDKSSTSKSLVDNDQVEVGKSKSKEIHRDVGNVAKERGSSDLKYDPGCSSPLISEKTLIHQVDDQAKTSDISDVTRIIENGDIDISRVDSTITGPKLLGDSVHSTSILEKLFGNAMTIGSSGTTNDVEENHGAKTNDIWSPNSLQSKFASWFIEEDTNQNTPNSSDIHTNKKPIEDISLRKPNDLLSLIVGGDMSHEMRVNHVNFNTGSSITEIPEQLFINKAVDPKPDVLTCEDLEQSILLGIGGNESNSQLNEHKGDVLDAKDEHCSARIDNQASQHLLSLLQKGTESKNVTFSENESLHKACDQGVGIINTGNMNTSDNIGSGDVEGSHSCGKTLTLEALFGTAFMKELHSAQRGSVGSTGIDALKSDGTPLTPAINEVVNGIGNSDGRIPLLNEGIGNPHESGYWSGFHDPTKEVVYSKPPTLVDSNFERFEGGMGIPLLEEDPVSVCGPHDMVKPEFPYQNLHQQATSPLLHGQHMNHSKPLFPPLDLHRTQVDPHMKLLPRDAIIHRDVPMQFHFPGNMGGGLTGFDHPVHPMLSHMHNGGNLIQSRNSSGYVHEHINPIQGYPFGGHRQSSFGTPGFAPPGPETNNPPEAFQRLLEMELRANPKQMIPPFAGGGPRQMMYGHELDMGFRYR